jgi:hypothetical protein
MPNKFEININIASYIKESKKIDDFGDIHIKLDEYCFPSEGWTDFGSDIIYWWMESIIELLSEKEQKVACSFMDGNYRFDLAVKDPETCKIQCIREVSKGEEIWNESIVEIKQMIIALINTAEEFKNLLEKGGEKISADNYQIRINKLSEFL